jgi:hypothetical protein
MESELAFGVGRRDVPIRFMKQRRPLPTPLLPSSLQRPPNEQGTEGERTRRKNIYHKDAESTELQRNPKLGNPGFWLAKQSISLKNLPRNNEDALCFSPANEE